MRANGRDRVLGHDGILDPPYGPFVDFALGELHLCGHTADNDVICWGRDNFGQANPPD